MHSAAVGRKWLQGLLWLWAGSGRHLPEGQSWQSGTAAIAMETVSPKGGAEGNLCFRLGAVAAWLNACMGFAFAA